MPSHIVRPGQMRHTLYLQEATKSYGNPGTWANVASRPEVRCSIRTRSGDEKDGKSGERGERRLELEMRYRSDVTYELRFSDNGSPERTFDIVHIDNVGELNHKLIVEVVERRA